MSTQTPIVTIKLTQRQADAIKNSLELLKDRCVNKPDSFSWTIKEFGG